MSTPSSHPPELAAMAELRIKERERQRDFMLSHADTSNAPQRRLSRRAFVLIRLAIIVLIIVGVTVLYHFLYNLY